MDNEIEPELIAIERADLITQSDHEVRFQITGTWPNTCGEFVRVEADQEGAHYVVRMFGRQVDGKRCGDGHTLITGTWTTRLPESGTYSFEFQQPDGTALVITAGVETVAEARARWESVGVKTYSIDQVRTCGCATQFVYTAIVVDGEVDRLIYDEPDSVGRISPEMRYENAMRNALTVDEAFEMLEREKADAAAFRVTYDQQYGYPTTIFVDPDLETADDEIIWKMSDLKTNEPR